MNKTIGAVITAGLLGAITQSIFAQTGTISNTLSTTISTTYDTTAPIISNVNVESVTSYSAQIKWTTDEPADSRGTYSLVSGGYTFNIVKRCDNGGNVLQHCIELTSLYPGTKYYYKIESRNLAGMDAHTVGYFSTIAQSGMYTTATTTTTNTSTATTTGSTTTATTTTTNIQMATSSSVQTTATVTDTTAPVSATTTTAISATSTPTISTTTTSIQTAPLTQQTITTATSTTIAPIRAIVPIATTTTTTQALIMPTTPTTTTAIVPKPTSTQTIYPVAPVAKPVPLRTAVATPLSTSTPPAISPVTDVAPEIEPLKSKVTLKGGGNVLNGEEVYIKVNQTVRGIEMHLSRKDGASALYLGRAQFDATNAQWVFRWDSTQTPDGSYILFSLVTTIDGTSVRGDERVVIVKNEKKEVTGIAASEDTAGRGVLATSTLVKGDEKTPVAASVPVVSVENFIEKIKEENQKEEEQIKNDIAGILLMPEVGTKEKIKPGLKEATEKKLEALKNALDEGDSEKKKEIIADIVNTAVASSGGAAQDVLTKKVEETVAKLEQVVVERKDGVVDVENFSVDAVKVAEVVTMPDGTKTASKLEFKGKALPNSFATVYIFSIPIVVTVKTDKDGFWSYTLDKELENGEHKVFVAITDVKGAVVAKSSLLPFVKEASAITLAPVALAAPAQQNSPSFATDNYFYGSIVAIVLMVIAIFILLGIGRRDASQP